MWLHRIFCHRPTLTFLSSLLWWKKRHSPPPARREHLTLYWELSEIWSIETSWRHPHRIWLVKVMDTIWTFLLSPPPPTRPIPLQKSAFRHLDLISLHTYMYTHTRTPDTHIYAQAHHHITVRTIVSFALYNSERKRVAKYTCTLCANCLFCRAWTQDWITDIKCDTARNVSLCMNDSFWHSMDFSSFASWPTLQSHISNDKCMLYSQTQETLFSCFTDSNNKHLLTETALLPFECPTPKMCG